MLREDEAIAETGGGEVEREALDEPDDEEPEGEESRAMMIVMVDGEDENDWIGSNETCISSTQI